MFARVRSPSDMPASLSPLPYLLGKGGSYVSISRAKGLRTPLARELHEIPGAGT